MQTGTEDAGAVQEEPLEPATDAAPIDAPEESTETIETPNEDPVKNESARDTVKRALEEERKKLGDGNEGAKEEAREPLAAKPIKAKQVKAKKGEFDPEMFPPERLKAAEKELFNELPLPLKKAFHRTIKELEGVTTRDATEYKRTTTEARGVLEVVQPFAREWAEMGFSVPAAIAKLAASQSRLIDPKTSKAEYIRIGKDLNIDFAELAGGEPTSESGQIPDIENHPKLILLQNKLDGLLSEREQERSRQVSTQAQSIVSELETVRDEKDQYGRYRYPKMHEPEFLERVKPLVAALRRTAPDLSWADAMKRAYVSLEGDSAQLNPPRLPTAEATNQRALSAAVSVRGRTAPATSGIMPLDKVPDSPRDTVRMVLEQMRRGA